MVAEASVVSAGASVPRWEDDPVLTVEHLTMRFGGLLAVRDLSFSVGRGDITALIGPNGAGKTTVFNCVTGFYKPTEGRIAMRHGPGKQEALVEEVTASGLRWKKEGNQGVFLLERMPDYEISHRAGVARTFQNIRLCPNLTVRQNIAIAYTTAQRHRRERLGGLTIERLMDQLGIAQSAEYKASELAYGTQRRVEIARALALAPDFLLLDEPTAGMIEGETQELVSAIMEIRDWMGCGVIVIDHDLSFITNLCERIYVLDMGRLVASGPPSVLRDDPKVAEIYLGRKARRQAAAPSSTAT